MQRPRLMILVLMLAVLSACSAEEINNSRLQSMVSDSDMATSYLNFTLRDKGAEKSLAAKNAIKATIDRTQRDWDNHVQYINLIEWYAKTSLYHAMVYLPNKLDRIKSYQALIAVLEQTVSPAVLYYDQPSYYYFKAFALMNIADDGTTIEQLQSLTELNKIYSKSFDSTLLQSYEGGGLDRIKARTRSADYYRGVPGGTYSPDGALFLANRALKSDAYPSQADGQLYCENVKIKGEVEKILGSGRKKHALMRAQTIHDFNSFIQDELIPEDIRAETNLCLFKMKEGIAKDGFTVEELFSGKDDHYFTYAASASFIPTGVKEGKLTLEAYCPSDILFTAPTTLAKADFFDYKSSLSGTSASISFDLQSDELGCKDFFLLFDTSFIPLVAPKVVAPFTDYGLTNEIFASTTQKELDEVKSLQMVNFSVSMAQQLLAQPNMFCLIKSAEKNPRVESAFLQKLKGSYFDTFGVLFDDPDHQFSCPPTQTLTAEIKSCQLNPAKSTPFCNSYRLYQQALDWIDKQLVDTNARLIRLTNKESELFKKLDSLRGRLQEEVDNSDEVLGSDD